MRVDPDKGEFAYSTGVMYGSYRFRKLNGRLPSSLVADALRLY